MKDMGTPCCHAVFVYLELMHDFGSPSSFAAMSKFGVKIGDDAFEG